MTEATAAHHRKDEEGWWHEDEEGSGVHGKEEDRGKHEKNGHGQGDTGVRRVVTAAAEESRRETCGAIHLIIHRSAEGSSGSLALRCVATPHGLLRVCLKGTGA